MAGRHVDSAVSPLRTPVTKLKGGRGQGARVNSPRRLVVLDGMRGVGRRWCRPSCVAGGDGVSLLPRGYPAVDFFFMLSGFVMARTYEPRLAAGLGVRAFMGARMRGCIR